MKLSGTSIPFSTMSCIVAFAATLLTTPVTAQQSGYSEPDDALGVRLCMTCHGALGQGSPVVGGPNLAGMEPWYLRRQLENFRAGVRGYQEDYIAGYEMRASVQWLSDTDIDAIVGTIASWKSVDAKRTIAGDARRGKALYSTCSACHGASAEGNEVLGAPALHTRSDWYLLKQMKLFKSGYRGTHPDDSMGAQMQAIIGTLETETDMQDVVAYLNSF